MLQWLTACWLQSKLLCVNAKALHARISANQQYARHTPSLYASLSSAQNTLSLPFSCPIWNLHSVSSESLFPCLLPRTDIGPPCSHLCPQACYAPLVPMSSATPVPHPCVSLPDYPVTCLRTGPYLIRPVTGTKSTLLQIDGIKS